LGKLLPFFISALMNLIERGVRGGTPIQFCKFCHQFCKHNHCARISQFCKLCSAPSDYWPDCVC